MISDFPDAPNFFDVVENDGNFFIALPKETKLDTKLSDNGYKIKFGEIAWHAMNSTRLAEMIGIVYDGKDEVFFDTIDSKEKRVISNETIIAMTMHLFKQSVLEVTVKKSVANSECNDYELFNGLKSLGDDIESIAHSFHGAVLRYNNVIDKDVIYYVWLTQEEQKNFSPADLSNIDFIKGEHKYMKRINDSGIHYHIPLSTQIIDMKSNIVDWFCNMKETTSDFKNISFTGERTFYQIVKINPFVICDSQNCFYSSIINLDCVDFSNFTHNLYY